MKLAITEPWGKIGHKLVEELNTRGGHDLVLLAPNERKVADLIESGVTVRTGHLSDRNYFANATRDVDALFFVLPMDSHSENFLADSERIIDNAAHAVDTNDIDRVVFVSSVGAHLDEGTGPIRLLRRAEQRLGEVAPNLTVLRPVFYMDRMLGWMNEIAENGRFSVPMNLESEIPMVATRDVAHLAADILADTKWSGRRIMPLAGPRPYSYREVADILTEILGSDVEPMEVAPAEMAKRLMDRGWKQPAVEGYLELYETLAKGGIDEELPRSKWLTQPTTFEEFARREFLPAFRESEKGAVTAPRI